MLKAFWKEQKPSGLINNALEEIYSMLEQEEAMFRSVCSVLLNG